MVDPLGVSAGLVLALVVVGSHYVRGSTWEATEDISQQVIEHRAASVPETDFPEPMNRSIGGGGAVAVGAGGAEGELQEGSEETAGDSPASIPDDEAESFEIEFVKEGVTLDIRENETILDAGEDEGLDLPFACREGMCLSCGGRVTDGPSEDFLVHDNQQMLDENELDDGYTLTCVAYPTADFSLETREAP